MPFVNPEPATAVTKLTKKTPAFFLFTFHWVHLQENRKKHIKKYMCITYTFLFMYCVPLSSYVLLTLFKKKNQFCSRKRKETIGAVPVICSLASHFAMQVCGVSFLFQVVIGHGSSKHGNITGVQANCKSSFTPSVCSIVL